ncbi:hypothetical protein AB0M23_20975 [Streptomyces sp. NPDC052077]|uniref:hypothetical protein n=1 Tax=Streptomyces sp. NPDC052077 TaxID=3154757 RepID=UPI00341FB122
MTLLSPETLPAVALGSLGVATASLLTAFTAYRVGGPRTGFRCHIVRYGTGEYALRLVASNRGRAPVTVDVRQLDVSWQYDDRPWRDTHRTLWPVFPADFPFRLEGNTRVEWSCPATELMTEAVGRTPNTWRLHIRTGHRERRVRVSRTITLVDRAAAAPLR